MFSRLLSSSEHFYYLYYTVYSCPCYHLVINGDTRMMDGGLYDSIISVIFLNDKGFHKTRHLLPYKHLARHHVD